jgi:hypothetical protein
MDLAYAVIAAGVVTLTWVLIFGRTQDRPPQPDPALHEAQHRVTDDGLRPGDDDQWRRLRTQVPHIRRQAVAEQRAEEARGV